MKKQGTSTYGNTYMLYHHAGLENYLLF